MRLPYDPSIVLLLPSPLLHARPGHARPAGFSSHGSRGLAISLSFDACFDTSPDSRAELRGEWGGQADDPRQI
jgi:hypothetical protein